MQDYRLDSALLKDHIEGRRQGEGAMGVCVVTGVGPGNGIAIVNRFARQGYQVAMLARNTERLQAWADAEPNAHAFPTDITSAEQITETFAAIRKQLGPVDVLVHNAGTGTFSSFVDTSPEQLNSALETNVFGLLYCGQESVSDMLAKGSGAVIVTGATASLRGGANFAGFAPAKAAQRSLCQSMARSLGPQGVHVAYLIIDGIIDSERTRRMIPAKTDDDFINPKAIADVVYQLAHQDKSCWTFELDIRPYTENW
ncbi:MAG: SDR family NAD(P)-dependent oxidoreductase [Myxococcota bacterium]|nr:SDR family NAD(P)-dependent oxidoreductase [Myxococcota bacterium]